MKIPENLRAKAGRIIKILKKDAAEMGLKLKNKEVYRGVAKALGVALPVAVFLVNDLAKPAGADPHDEMRQVDEMKKKEKAMTRSKAMRMMK